MMVKRKCVLWLVEDIQSSAYSNHGNDFEILLTLERKGFLKQIRMIFMLLNGGALKITDFCCWFGDLWFIRGGLLSCEVFAG